MHFPYVFILQFLSDRLVLRLEPTIRPSSQARLHDLYRAADTVNLELMMMNEMDVWNM